MASHVRMLPARAQAFRHRFEHDQYRLSTA
jgi:hypothetical protein